METLELNDQDALMSFLNSQRKLETLRLVNIIDLFESRTIKIRPQFKLKELVMLNLPFLDSSQVISFLKHMEDSVQYLELGIELNVQICEYVLLNFKNVHEMRLDYECLPRPRFFYQKMQANKNLKILMLKGNMRSSKTLIRFLRKHQRIEELVLSGEMRIIFNLNGILFP